MDTKEIKQLIQSKGLKATPQRIAIYDAMTKLGHASADVLAEKVINEHPTLTVATVYNILDTYVKCGLLRKLVSANVKMYFDINTDEHYHFYCTDTNEIFDIKDSKLIRLVNEEIVKRCPENFDIESIDVIVSGKSPMGMK